MNRVQTLRSSVAGNRPAAGSRAVGELYVNFADKVLGYIDPALNPIDVSNTVVTADVAPTTPHPGMLWYDSIGGQLYVWYDDGSSQQWVIVVNNMPNLTGYAQLSGATFTGALIGTSADFSTQVEAQGFHSDAPVGTSHGFIATTNGVTRWGVVSPGAPTETGGNTGSDLWISMSDDTGASLAVPIQINRATSVVNIQGAGFPTNFLTSVTPVVGGATLALNKANAGGNNIFGTNQGLARWQLSLGSGAAESGANAGSDCSLSAYPDSGIGASNVFSVSRATQIVTFAKTIVNPSARVLKQDITPVDGALDIIEKLQGVFYKYKDDPKRQVGLIAEDVEPVLPEVVHDASGEDKPTLGIAYAQIVAVLVEAVKELSAELKSLKAGARS